MRMTRIAPKSVIAAAFAAIMCVGCTAADQQRWNEFWGLDQTGHKRTVRNRPTANRRSTPDKANQPRTAASDSKHDADASADRGDPAEINAYASRVKPIQGGDYEANDHLAKIRRQQDSNRRKHAQPDDANDNVKTRPEPAPADDSIVRKASAKRDTAQNTPTKNAAAVAKDPPVFNSPAVTPKQEPVAIEDEPQVRPQSQPIAEPVKTPSETPLTASANPIGEVSVEENPPKASPADKLAEPPMLKNVSVAAGPVTPTVAPQTNTAEPKAISANEPAVAAQTIDTFTARIEELQQLVESDPSNLEQQLRLRMLYLADGQDKKALAAIPGSDAEIEEIIKAQLQTLISARSEAGRDPATWANRQIESLDKLRQMIGEQADLTVPTVAICTRVSGFGIYEPITPLKFQAGVDKKVLVYIEVENFSSQKTPSGLYRTLLSVRETLLTREGQELRTNKDENIEDLARRQRRDFYVIVPLAIPRTLAAGEYMLKVEVEDVLAGKINSNVIRFTMTP